MKDGDAIIQTPENLNIVPRIKVVDSFLKEVEIKKELISQGDTKGNLLIYRVAIAILDDTGGRHKVTEIIGLVKDKLEIKI
jgi:hypothetical protein